MKFYLKYSIIYISLVLGINLAFNWHWKTLVLFLQVAATVCFPAIIVSLIARIIPRKFYTSKNKIFFVRKKENKFYEKIKIKNWKSKVPEAGKLGGFKKDKLYDPTNPEYLRNFITESCIAEFIHSVSIIWGFVALLLIPRRAILPLGLPLVLFNIFVHIFPIMIQRYIRPKLMRTLTMVERRSEAKKQAETESAKTESPAAAN